MAPLFGLPDSAILGLKSTSPAGASTNESASDFHAFKFKSIGKQPDLLKRISSFEEGVQYQYSPSPEPQPDPAQYQYSPSPEFQEQEPLPIYGRNGNETAVRTRPSLLQALTSQGDQSQESSSSFSGFEQQQQQQQPLQQHQPQQQLLQPRATVEPSEIDDDSMSMVLRYPETPVHESQQTPVHESQQSNGHASTSISMRKTKSPAPAPAPPPPPPPFIPNYTALKDLHARLERAHKVLATPPPPRPKKPSPSPTPAPAADLSPQLSLIAANKALHHSEKTHTAAKEALQASQTRAAISEHGVTAAQTVVDSLVQALAAARMTLEVAQKTLAEARQAAEEARAALLSSRAAADAAEETKRLLEEPPPPPPKRERVPTPEPEPVNENAELIEEMKRDLEALRLWVTEQEAGHAAPAAVVQQAEASNNVPDEVHMNGDANDVPPDGGSEAVMELDEPRRLEEDAARALVELAEQFTTPEQVRRVSITKEATTEEDKPEQASGADAEEQLPANEAALAREAVLRKQQEARREQVRIQKEQAHAAAALSILKERQDAATAMGKSVAPMTQASPPVSNDGTQHVGNVVAKNTVVPTQVKAKAKKSKPVSGGVKLGPELTAKVESSSPDLSVSSADPAASSEPSPALERAAALGLRVRTKPASEIPKPAETSAPSAKPKKTRHHSIPPISHVDPESPQSDNNISAHRMGSDPGNIPIITEAPKMPADVATDVQLMNLRFVLQDEGITWEAISRSRPPRPGVKTEEVEVDLRASAAQVQPKAVPTPPAPRPPLVQRPPVNSPPITATTHSAAPAVSAPSAPAPRPPPSKKQLPKFNKTKPQAGNTGNNEASRSSAVSTSARPPVQLHRLEQPPAKAPPTTKPSSPVVAAPIPVKAQPLPRAREDSRSSNAGSGVSTPVQDGNSGRSLNERVWRGRSPPRVAPYRSRTPDRDDRDRWDRDRHDRDRYGGRGPGTYSGGEPERFPRRSSPPPPARWSPPPSNEYPWSYPRSPRSPSPYLRRAKLTPSPPPPHPGSSAKRTFPADYASHRQPAPAPFYPPSQDSPPKGPRYNIPRVPSQKRPREDEYSSPFHSHPQKRFKDDGRDAPVPSRSFDHEMDRPSLENRLGAPPDLWNGHPNPEYENQNWYPRGEGLLSRLSDPARGAPRGRGGPRGRANKTRGRGRGEVSLADRLAGGP
ncbi:hypothetical protein MSAN_01456300 [Mycena sanguinolenta]|uniref:Uncharacterized protein n=1 Tax=Mycena sanguinolenta TaxID=230812 RepID=A0A8H6YAY1_9AGAR|nr:hypothetical protein MSAN_01456300 [Mycena sanguinolenta]